MLICPVKASDSVNTDYFSPIDSLVFLVSKGQSNPFYKNNFFLSPALAKISNIFNIKEVSPVWFVSTIQFRELQKCEQMANRLHKNAEYAKQIGNGM